MDWAVVAAVAAVTGERQEVVASKVAPAVAAVAMAVVPVGVAGEGD